MSAMDQWTLHTAQFWQCDKLIEHFEVTRTAEPALEIDQENRLDESDLRSEFILDPTLNPKMEHITPKADAEVKVNENGKRASESVGVNGNATTPASSPKKKRIKLNLNFKRKGPQTKRRGPAASAIQKAKNVSRKGGAQSKDSKTFEVEKITNKRIQNGELLYQVKWKNFKGSTWEPEENLMCDDLIDEFESKMVECQKRKQELLNSSAVASAKNNSASGNLRAASESTTERQAKKSATARMEAEKGAQRNSRRNSVKESNSPAIAGADTPSATTRNSTASKRAGRPPAISALHHQLNANSTPSEPTNSYAVDNKVVLGPTMSLDGSANSLPNLNGGVALKILGVRRGSFPGQGPIAHVHNESTNVDEYVPIGTLHAQCPQLLCVYYEEYLNLRP